MALLDIISIPDPILRKRSNPVEKIDDVLLSLLDDMAETMYAAPGIGLAGVQIAQLLRIVTVDVSDRPTNRYIKNIDEIQKKETFVKELLFLINPVIVSLGEEFSIFEEGCLSIPNYLAQVERPASCVVEYVDRQGEKQILQADGLLSTCLQHEIDHLNGTLFIDHISKLKRDMVIRKFTKNFR